jgi:hypothetical protein
MINDKWLMLFGRKYLPVIAMSVSEEAIQKPAFHAFPFALDFVLNSDLYFG